MNKGGTAIGAFVLCGGLGTRLRSVVSDRPKSMALVAGVPFLEILLRQLRDQGVREVVLGTGYMADQIEKYFGDGKILGLALRYSRETEPLGTGGAVKLAERSLGDPTLVINGDSYVDYDLAAMESTRARTDAALVMMLQSVPDVSRYGSVKIERDGRVKEFVEKGKLTGPGLINAGVYLLRKGVLAALPPGKPVSLEREIFPGLLREKVYGLVSNGIFVDIGIPADLERAQTLLGTRASDS